MSRILPFCRAFLEHLDLTLADQIFLVSNLGYYLPIERKMASGKRASNWFLADFVKAVSKIIFPRRNCLYLKKSDWFLLLYYFRSFLSSGWLLKSVFLFFLCFLAFWLTKCLNRAQIIRLNFQTSFMKMARNRWDALFPNACYAQYVDNSPY